LLIILETAFVGRQYDFNRTLRSALWLRHEPSVCRL